MAAAGPEALLDAARATYEVNNLDNAIGAVYSGEDAIATIIDWVKAHSNWDDSAMIVTSDHGHYLVLDDPSGQDLDTVRRIRDELDRRVQRLIAELLPDEGGSSS